LGDRIELRGIEAYAHHGVYDHEQASGQQFLIDLVIETDLSGAGASDDLADTIDYGALAVAVHDVSVKERWNLIERLAQRIAETALALDPRIETVTVTVHKPDAPIPLAFGDVAVTIERSR
jgi:dihydroneopterin aldolase